MKKKVVVLMSALIVSTTLGMSAHGIAGFQKRQEAKPDAFTLSISTKASKWIVGERLEIQAVLRNRSGASALLVHALDGSDSGMRYPHVRFEVTAPVGAPPPGPVFRCGNTNNITVDDFSPVADGEDFDPLGSWARLRPELFPVPGKYTIRLIYDTRGKRKEWYGFMGRLKNKAGIRRRLGKVPKMHLSSNAIAVEVFDNSPNDTSTGGVTNH